MDWMSSATSATSCSRLGGLVADLIVARDSFVTSMGPPGSAREIAMPATKGARRTLAHSSSVKSLLAVTTLLPSQDQHRQSNCGGPTPWAEVRACRSALVVVTFSVGGEVLHPELDGCGNVVVAGSPRGLDGGPPCLAAAGRELLGLRRVLPGSGVERRAIEEQIQPEQSQVPAATDSDRAAGPVGSHHLVDDLSRCRVLQLQSCAAVSAWRQPHFDLGGHAVPEGPGHLDQMGLLAAQDPPAGVVLELKRAAEPKVAVDRGQPSADPARVGPGVPHVLDRRGGNPDA